MTCKIETNTVAPGVTFSLPTSEGIDHPTPYQCRVYAEHPRDFGFWDCVIVSGGHPARHNQIITLGESRILDCMSKAYLETPALDCRIPTPKVEVSWNGQVYEVIFYFDGTPSGHWVGVRKYVRRTGTEYTQTIKPQSRAWRAVVNKAGDGEILGRDG